MLASVHLSDKQYAGEYLLNCSIILSYLGQYMDKSANGEMLLQYGEICSGKKESGQRSFGSDIFYMRSDEEDEVCQFLYENTDEKDMFHN